MKFPTPCLIASNPIWDTRECWCRSCSDVYPSHIFFNIKVVSTSALLSNQQQYPRLCCCWCSVKFSARDVWKAHVIWWMCVHNIIKYSVGRNQCFSLNGWGCCVCFEIQLKLFMLILMLMEKTEKNMVKVFLSLTLTICNEYENRIRSWSEDIKKDSHRFEVDAYGL